MGKKAQKPADIHKLLTGQKPSAEQLVQLRRAQALSPNNRRELERLVVELMENPGPDLTQEEAALVVGAGLWALGRLEEAVASLVSASGPDADYILGRCYLEMGHYERAAEALERAQRGKAATKHLAAIAHAEAVARGGRPDAALSAARALVRSHPTDPDARYVLGLCYDLNGRYEDAVQEYEKVLEVSPGHAAASFRLGYIHALRGDPEWARQHYEAIAYGTPEYVNALINLGVLYEDQREFEKAIECYRRVLRLEPNNQRARLYLKDAYGSLDMVFDEDRERELERRARLMNVPLDDFEFSVRVRNCLQRMNINTVGGLVHMTEEELLHSKNFGETSLQEIKEVLAARGLRLGEGREEAAAEAPSAPPEAPAVEVGEADEATLERPVADLELSVRTRICMEREGIKTIGELVSRRAEELLAIRNFGRTSLAEVTEKLARLGLRLPQAQPEEAEDQSEADEDA